MDEGDQYCIEEGEDIGSNAESKKGGEEMEEGK